MVTDADGAPYLRYVNHKMKRQALVPIDEQLHALIVEQQARVGEAPVLFPRADEEPRRPGTDRVLDLPARALPVAGLAAKSATPTATRCG